MFLREYSTADVASVEGKCVGLLSLTFWPQLSAIVRKVKVKSNKNIPYEVLNAQLPDWQSHHKFAMTARTSEFDLANFSELLRE